MCNEYTESVLHPSDIKSQIVKNTIEKQYGKKPSTDGYSNYSGERKIFPCNNKSFIFFQIPIVKPMNNNGKQQYKMDK
jgi:hypothetical protein